MSSFPKVFFSYSIPKSSNPRIIQRVIQEAKSIVEKRGWFIIDPMTDVNLQSVRDKVEIALREADACIIECTASVPNVMFEAGFGRSLKYPIIFLVSPESRDNPLLHDYFEFIGLNKHRTLPADLGDIEYITYPSALSDSAEWTKFTSSLERILNSLDKSLALPARRLRRSSKWFMQETLRLAGRHPTDHPLLGLLSNWQSQLIDELTSGGESTFEIEAAYYRRCIESLSKPGSSAEILAIADLSDETELFWRSQSDPLKATERSFLVNWRVFFDTHKLSKFGRILREQSNYYTVRFGDTTSFSHVKKVFGPTAQGHHLLLISPDLIGGYIEREGRKYLRLERSESRYREAKNVYQATHKLTVRANPFWSDSEIRSAWMEHNEIGCWNPVWGKVANRGIDYTGKYDLHIRAWIPDYDKLIGCCLSIVQSELIRQIRGTTRRLRIMEIGFGTGALTIPLIQWIDNLNSPFLELQGEPTVDLYVGVDESASMKLILQNKLEHIRPRTRSLLYEGSALESLPVAATNTAPYDLICGTLVLHDILETNPAKVQTFLSQASKYLTPHGCMVFADIFTDDDDKNREEQVNKWKDRIISHGLSRENMNLFINHNPEMTKTVRQAHLATLAEQNGFGPPEFRSLPATDGIFPFKILILRKGDKGGTL
jgi:hypothetical protein